MKNSMNKKLSKAMYNTLLTHSNVSKAMKGSHVDLNKVKHIAKISNIILPAGLLAGHGYIPRWVNI